jgi:hypothetical protein
MASVKINRVKDFIERAGWTFAEALIGLGLLDQITNGINLSLWHWFLASVGAAVVATVKVLIAQNVGTHKDGSAIPGGVIEGK